MSGRSTRTYIKMQVCRGVAGAFGGCGRVTVIYGQEPDKDLASMAVGGVCCATCWGGQATTGWPLSISATSTSRASGGSSGEVWLVAGDL